MESSPRIHLVATLKNEAPYLVEWIAWYKSIGVTDFTLFSNDCTDGTNLMLDRLDVLGEVRHFDNPLGPRMDPQRRAYSRAGKMDEVRDADWLLVVDADEFVHVRVGDGTLAALIRACDGADAISLGWQPVGSGGMARWVDAPVTARFTRGGATEPPDNKMVWGFKTLFRPNAFDYFGVHRPKFDKKKRDTFPKVRWVNGSGADISKHVVEGGWRFGRRTVGYAYGCVNHYAVKSREEFLLKRLRGTANSKNADRLNIGYWNTFDLNSTPLPPLDTGPLNDEMARLLADADLAALRRASVATARRVLDGQLQDDEARAFVEAGAAPVDPENAPDTGPEVPPAPVARNSTTLAKARTSGTRFLCVGTHHKTGTMWMRSTLHQVGSEQGIPVTQVVVERHIAELPDNGPVICVNWDSSFPRAMLEREDARFLHVVRDPRDVLVSGMRYHRIAPTARERFLLRRRPEWGGLTYQDHLNALPGDVERLLFEMQHKHADTMAELLRWDYGRANTIELRYEDLINDPECRLFRAALVEADVNGLDIDRAVSAFWDNALFGGQADPDRRHPRTALHIHSGKAAQWPRQLPREVATAYAARFGEALRILGYAEDDRWVAQCRPAAELASEALAG